MQTRGRASWRSLLRRAGLRGVSPAALVAGALLVLAVGTVGLSQAGALRPGLVIRRADALELREPGGEAGEAPSGTLPLVVEAEAPTGRVTLEGSGSGGEGSLTVVVHVDGAVAQPGVYEVTSGCPRVVDAVEMAGGLAADADTTSVNLAATLADGQKVFVPREGEAVPEGVAASAGIVSGGAAAKVNINTATEEELKALPGIGEVTAKAIVQERERGGPFATPEDLMRVSGIGQKKYERLAGEICV